MRSLIAFFGQNLVYLSVGSIFFADLSLGWRYGIGVAAVNYGFFLWNALGLRIASGPLRGVTAVYLLVYALLFSLRRHRHRIPPAKFIDWHSGLYLFLLSVYGLLAVIQAMALPLYHLDAIIGFGLKSKLLIHAGTFKFPYFYERGIINPVPNYPLLVPYGQAFFYWLVGAVRDDNVRIWHAVIGAAWLSMIVAELRRHFTLRTSLLWAALFFTLPGLYRDNETQLVSGISDIPFAFFWTGVFLSGLRYWKNPRQIRPLTVMILFSIGCVFTKSNGTILTALAWGLLYAQRRKPEILKMALLLGLLLVPWFVIQSGLPHDFTTPRLSFDTMAARGWQGLVFYSRAMIRILFDRATWGIFWVLMPALFMVSMRDHRPINNYLALLLALQLIVYGAIILMEPVDLGAFIGAQMPRWMFHVAPLALFLISESFVPLISQKEIA